MPVFGANLNVIGNKLDDEFGVSIYSELYLAEKHIHSKCEIYPLLADPVLLTKAAGAWAAFPTPTEIVPVNTILVPFDIHWVNISNISADGNYVIQLYSGNPGSEIVIATIDFARNAVLSQEGAQPCQTIVLPANTRISAAISSGNAAADNCRAKIKYHVY